MMAHTMEEKFRAARYRQLFLRVSIDHFHQERVERIKIRHAEIFGRLRIIPLGSGERPELRFLRRDRA